MCVEQQPTTQNWDILIPNCCIMKKVSVSKQSVFDDPLFNPGDSFNARDSDEYVAPVAAKTQAPELLNTLTISDEESFLTTAKPMKTSKPKPTPTSKSTPVVPEVVVLEKEKSPPPPRKAEKPTVTEKTDPLKATKSVFESEGEDLFLPSSEQKKKKEPNFEEELFGQSSLSQSELRDVKLSGSGNNLRLGRSDNDDQVSECVHDQSLSVLACLACFSSSAIQNCLPHLVFCCCVSYRLKT
jgi:hypothetical protein